MTVTVACALVSLTLMLGLTVTTSSPAAATDALDSAAIYSQIDLGESGSYSALGPAAVENPGGTSAGEVTSSQMESATQAHDDLVAAYNAVASLTPTALISGDLGGRTILPGIYRSEAALAMTTSVTFDARGDPNAVFIFQVGAAVNTTAVSTMIMVNGAQASHIYWQTVGAVTTGAQSSFTGTILGNAAITAGAGTSIEGRALTQSGAVTLDGATLLPVPDITMRTSVAPSIDVEAGDPVTFTSIIRNRGNVALALRLDTRSDGVETTIAWPDSARVLPAGRSIVATSSYVPTLADAAAGSVTLPATVTGTPVGFRTVSASTGTRLAVYPTPVVDHITTAESVPVTFNVLLNDAGAETGGSFSRATQGTHRRLVGGARGPVPATPVSGGVTCVKSGADRGLCTYTPAGDFTGTDTFDYSLSQDTRLWNVRVTITVTPAADAPTAADNRVVATRGGPTVTFDPTANATAPAGSTGTLAIRHLSPLLTGDGALTCGETSCTFTPASGFTGIATATFEVAAVSDTGAPGPRSTPATITIFVDPPVLAPSGFAAAATTRSTVAVDTWTDTTTAEVSENTCVEGRPAATIRWPESARTHTWAIERRIVGTVSGPWISLGSVPALDTTYTDTHLGEGNAYEWRVRPDALRWHGVFSGETAATPPPAVDSVGC